jgi:hypothetical protein
LSLFSLVTFTWTATGTTAYIAIDSLNTTNANPVTVDNISVINTTTGLYALGGGFGGDGAGGASAGGSGGGSGSGFTANSGSGGATSGQGNVGGPTGPTGVSGAGGGGGHFGRVICNSLFRVAVYDNDTHRNDHQLPGLGDICFMKSGTNPVASNKLQVFTGSSWENCN